MINFLTVKGVGNQKFERYGQAFMNVIIAYVEEHPEIVPVASLKKEKQKRSGEPTHLESYRHYQAGKTIKEIAALRGLSVVTIESHLIKCAEESLEIDWEQIFSKAEYQHIIETANQLGGDKLKPLKEALPEEISYFMIKAALVKSRMDN